MFQAGAVLFSSPFLDQELSEPDLEGLLPRPETEEFASLALLVARTLRVAYDPGLEEPVASGLMTPRLL
jgi:hypothetical protein